MVVLFGTSSDEESEEEDEEDEEDARRRLGFLLRFRGAVGLAVGISYGKRRSDADATQMVFAAPSNGDRILDELTQVWPI